jgi:hypothetical protein
MRERITPEQIDHKRFLTSDLQEAWRSCGIAKVRVTHALLRINGVRIRAKRIG